MANIKPIRNHIIFQFIEEKVRHMGVAQFKETTDWGFEIVRADESAGKARWVTVKVVGPEVPDDIKPGMSVLVDTLKWTNEFEVDGESYWRTDSDCILAVDENSTPAS